MVESQQVKVVRVFLASPQKGTEQARAAVTKVVRMLNADPLYQRRFQCDLLRWNDEMRGLMFEADGSAQEDIGEQIGEPGCCDLVIGLFAHTLGGVLRDSRTRQFGQPPGQDRPWHCTEWEIDQALQGRRAGRVRSVWLFRDQRRQPEAHADLSPDEEAAYVLRPVAVKRFLEPLTWRPYSGPVHLADQVALGLRKWLDRQFPSVGVVSVSSTGTHPHDLPGYLARRREQWRSSAGGQLDRRFVNLKLVVDHGLEHDGPRHEVKGEYNLLAELLAERADVAAWVLVGDPGSGKSTILQHHEMTTVDAALAGSAGLAVPEVCVWHRLSEYSHDSAAPAEWLRTRWPKELPGLQALRGVARVRFLLDGLNEIKALDREKQLEAIDRWTAWAQQQAHDADVLAPIFSVRTLDQSPLGGKDFEVRQIVVARWTPEQIQAYCAHTLGEGNALWPVIEADKSRALLDLSALPFNLWAQCELYRALGRAATDRAELMGGMFWQMLARRVGDAPLKVAGLLGDQDRQQIASGAWKGMLRALPEQHGCLVPWLDETMQRLHRLGRQVSVTQDDLLAGLTGQPGWATPAQWLYAVRSLQLIGEGGADEYSTEPLLRCTHQLWQEFFAARGLRDLPTRDPARLPDLRPPALKPLEEVLARLGVQEPLPGPDPSHWEEPVKLAVQLVRDPLAWVRALEPVNLALAGRAAAVCRKKAEALHGAAVFDGLRQALLSRSRDAAVDVRLRIEAGLVLGELGDTLRYEEREGPHGRYLWPKQWVAISEGTYQIGRMDGLENEKPIMPVRLNAYEIAWAPVTNAEFRCFVESGGYDPCAPWWQGESAKAWLTGRRCRIAIDVERYLKFLIIIKLNPAVMEDWPDEAKYKVRRHLTMNENDVRVEEERERMTTPIGKLNFSSSPRFNQAAHPVVGICWFEAYAYAMWLSMQSKETVRLPLEAEWEAVHVFAQHKSIDTAQIFLNEFDSFEYKKHLSLPNPVGVFLDRMGMVEMGLDVFECTASAYVERHDAVSLVESVGHDGVRRVKRGFSWVNNSGGEQKIFHMKYMRNAMEPGDRSDLLGFRLVRGLLCSGPGSQDQRASIAVPSL